MMTVVYDSYGNEMRRFHDKKQAIVYKETFGHGGWYINNKNITNMEIEGILLKKMNERSGTSSKTGMEWRNAEYLMEVPGMFPKHILFKVSNGTVNRFANFDAFIGKSVVVSFDIEAHEYNGRWFNDVNAFAIRPKM